MVAPTDDVRLIQQQIVYLDVQTGLLQYLALHTVLLGLVRFNTPARKKPITVATCVFSLLEEQDLMIADDCCLIAYGALHSDSPLIWLYNSEVGGKQCRVAFTSQHRSLVEQRAAHRLGAQPPADGCGIVKWYGGKHEITFQKCPDSAGRLERTVGPLIVIHAALSQR